MRKYLSLSLMGFALSLTTLAAPSYASKLAGPIYTHTEREQKEFEHLYSGVNTLINSITGGATFSSLTVSSLTVTTINGLPPGKVFQVKIASTTTAQNSTSTSFTDTGLSVSITPSSSTSRVLIMALQSVGGVFSSASNTIIVDLQILRGSTIVSGPYSVSRFTNIANTTEMQTLGFIAVIDSPASTSSLTYKTQFARNASANAVTHSVQSNSTVSFIVAMEIAP